MPFGFLAWFSLARPISIISKLPSKDAFKAAYFYSFIAIALQIYWVGNVTPLGAVAAVLLMALYPALIFFLFNKLSLINRRFGLILLPILWTGMEYFRNLTEVSFPWTDLSYSQGYYLQFIQIASVIGAYGLSIIIVWLNILVMLAFEKSETLKCRYSSVVAFVSIIALLFAYGWVVIPKYDIEGNFRISLLQGNVDLATKWKPESRPRNFEIYDSLSQVASEYNPDLIIWPETSAPCYPNVESQYRRALSQTARKSRTDHLIGALDIEYLPNNRRKTFNSAFHFDSTGQIENIHHKVKLVPFSEHVPYQDHMFFLSRDFLEKYVGAIKTRDVQWWSDFYPGDSITLFTAKEVKYSVLICYEVAFPEFVREGVLKGAQFLTTITNDTWFGYSPGPYQHMIISLFRAVENRLWMARCANSGISAVVDPYGRQRVTGDLYEMKVLNYAIEPLDEKSLFTRIGPVFGEYSYYLTLAVIMFFATMALKKRFIK